MSQCEDLDILMTMSHQLKSPEEEGESSSGYSRVQPTGSLGTASIGEAVSRGLGRSSI